MNRERLAKSKERAQTRLERNGVPRTGNTREEEAYMTAELAMQLIIDVIDVMSEDQPKPAVPPVQWKIWDDILVHIVTEHFKGIGDTDNVIACLSRDQRHVALNIVRAHNEQISGVPGQLFTENHPT